MRGPASSLVWPTPPLSCSRAPRFLSYHIGKNQTVALPGPPRAVGSSEPLLSCGRRTSHLCRRKERWKAQAQRGQGHGKVTQRGRVAQPGWMVWLLRARMGEGLGERRCCWKGVLGSARRGLYPLSPSCCPIPSPPPGRLPGAPCCRHGADGGRNGGACRSRAGPSIHASTGRHSLGPGPMQQG